MWGEKIKPQILLNQTNKVNLDSHQVVRGLLMNKEKVKELEEEVGGVLIPDKKGDLLHVLDELAELIRRNNGGLHTPQRTIEFQNERYVHRDLVISPDVFHFQWGVDFNLGDTEIGGLKKMWFQLPTSLQINRSKQRIILP